jgi:hypothetical protein
MGIRYPYWGIEPFKVVNQIKHGGLTTEHEILVPKMGRPMQGGCQLCLSGRFFHDLIGGETNSSIWETDHGTVHHFPSGFPHGFSTSGKHGAERFRPSKTHIAQPSLRGPLGALVPQVSAEITKDLVGLASPRDRSAVAIELQNCSHHLWEFPKMGVPHSGWFIMQNPI